MLPSTTSADIVAFTVPRLLPLIGGASIIIGMTVWSIITFFSRDKDAALKAYRLLKNLFFFGITCITLGLNHLGGLFHGSQRLFFVDGVLIVFCGILMVRTYRKSSKVAH